MYNKVLYKRFLILEFGALAVLLGSLFWLGQIMQGGATLGPVLRAIPVLASGAVLIGFMGCMYVRWIGVASAEQKPKRVMFIIYWFLALTLFSVWLLAAAQWMMSDLSLPPDA